MVEKLVENKYRVTFMPRQNGKHRVYIYFNGYDVRGSPFIMRVGTKGRSGKTRSSPSHESSRYRSESPSMHFNTSMLKNESSSVRRELYSPQNVPKAGSYSPQLSPSFDDRYEIKTSKEVYASPRLTSPTRIGSPGRDLYSPKLVDEQQHHGYSTVYKSEFKKEIRKSQSPSLDYGIRDTTDFYGKKNVSKTNLTKDEGLYSSSFYSKLKNDSSFARKTDSPTLMSSPINVSEKLLPKSQKSESSNPISKIIFFSSKIFFLDARESSGAQSADGDDVLRAASS